VRFRLSGNIIIAGLLSLLTVSASLGLFWVASQGGIPRLPGTLPDTGILGSVPFRPSIPVPATPAPLPAPLTVPAIFTPFETADVAGADVSEESEVPETSEISTPSSALNSIVAAAVQAPEKSGSEGSGGGSVQTAGVPTESNYTDGSGGSTGSPNGGYAEGSGGYSDGSGMTGYRPHSWSGNSRSGGHDKPKASKERSRHQG